MPDVAEPLAEVPARALEVGRDLLVRPEISRVDARDDLVGGVFRRPLAGEQPCDGTHPPGFAALMAPKQVRRDSVEPRPGVRSSGVVGSPLPERHPEYLTEERFGRVDAHAANEIAEHDGGVPVEQHAEAARFVERRRDRGASKSKGITQVFPSGRRGFAPAVGVIACAVEETD